MADRRLQVFYTVARQLSFTRASELLFMTQPAVTFQIKQLEEHFNTRLFERSHGRIALTPAGELALGYAERILSLSAELETRMAELTGQVSGVLVVGASTTIAEYMLPGLLGRFKEQYPQAHPRLMVANSEVVVGKVADHAIDLGLVEGSVQGGNLESEVWGEDELVVVAAPENPVAALGEADPHTLAGLAWVVREEGSGTREVVDEYLRGHGGAPEDMNIVMELGSPEAIKGAVAANLGVSVLSRASVQRELRLGDLVAVPLQPRLRRPLSLLVAPGKFRSRLVQTFIEYVRRNGGGAA